MSSISSLHSGNGLEARFRAGLKALRESQGIEARLRAAASGRIAGGAVGTSTAIDATSQPVLGGGGNTKASGPAGIETQKIDLTEATSGSWVAETDSAKQEREIGEDLEKDKDVSLKLDSTLSALGRTGTTPAVLRGQAGEETRGVSAYGRVAASTALAASAEGGAVAAKA